MHAPVLVIGGSRGIGHRLSERLIGGGASLITVGRSPEAPFASQPHIRCDVVQEDLPLDQLPDQLAGLVYCPGSIDLAPLRGLKADQFRAALELNVVGAFRCVQACAERLRGGSVVLFSTVAVQRGMPFHTGVAAAKGAVEGLTRALAAELAPKVRVNCIAPGLTRTPLADRLLNTPDKEAAAGKRHPLGRIGEPDDVAAMAQFLLSSEAGWITGQVIGVDGGMSAI